MPTPEGIVLKACLDFLRMKGIFCWRNNQGVIPTGKGGYRRFQGLKGVSDILGILPDGTGRFLAIECKRPGAYLRPEQKIFLRRISDLCGIALVVRSVDELESGLENVGIL
jgi:hypothetical protein